MAADRRNAQGATSLDSLRVRLDELDGTPLQPVGKMLVPLLASLTLHGQDAESQQGRAILEHVGYVLDSLPSDLGQRFTFDALMIKALTEQLSSDRTGLSNVIVPTYGHDWEFQRIRLRPDLSDSTSHREFILELVRIRGTNSIDCLDLSDYSWMVHEMMHSVFYQSQEAVIGAIKARLKRHLDEHKLAGIVDQHQTQTVRQSQLGQLEQVWTPEPKQKNWPHELVIDVLGVILAAPAYVSTFLTETDGTDLDPFEILQSHPPHAVRCLGMARAATLIGWSQLAERLTDRKRRWDSDRAFQGPSNAYFGLGDPDLVNDCVDAAFDLVKHFQFDVCSKEHFQAAAANVKHGKQPALGLEMLLAARYAADNKTPDDYDAWVHKVVNHTLEED